MLRLSLLLGLLGILGTSCVMTSVSRAQKTKDSVTSTSVGGLHDTRALPPFGKGYRIYSYLGAALGRQYGHHLTIQTLENTFAALHEHGRRRYEVAEIGLDEGGEMWPHATHREGLSVDIMTPMKRGERPARLLTGPLSLWGYCWRIDEQTYHVNGYAWEVANPGAGPTVCPRVPFPSKKEVDFDALRDLINTLQAEANALGGLVRVVIVDPSFVKPLSGAKARLSTQAWREHDEHIHVEFRF